MQKIDAELDLRDLVTEQKKSAIRQMTEAVADKIEVSMPSEEPDDMAGRARIVRWIEDSLQPRRVKEFNVQIDDLIQLGQKRICKFKPDFSNFCDFSIALLYVHVVKKREFQISPERMANYLKKQRLKAALRQQIPETSNESSSAASVRSSPSSKFQTICNFPQFAPLHLKNFDQTISSQNTLQQQQTPVKARPQTTLTKSNTRAVTMASESAHILNSETKLIEYVDKQVRKELKRAIQQQDLDLLQNFMSQFGATIAQR